MELDDSIDHHDTDGQAPSDDRSADPVAAAAIRLLAAGEVAHRIRTPLSVVLGSIHAASGQPDLDQRLRRQLEVAGDQAEQVRIGVEELASIGRWPDQLTIAPVRLGQIVSDAAVGRLSGQTWQGFTYEIEAEDTSMVAVDAPLAAWAIDVLLRASIGGCLPDGHLSLRCRDDGDGVVATIEAHGDGSLSFAHDAPVEVASLVVAMFGGTVEPSSDPPRRGFELRLPAAGSPPVVPVAPGRNDARRMHGPPAVVGASAGDSDIVGPDGAPLVLIVEDDDVLRAFLTDHLSIEHRVVTATSAEAALDLVERLRPDLIACDLELPGAGGEHLVRELQRDPDLNDIPVIVVTGRDDDAQRARLLRSGVDDFVTKPLSTHVLRARIANLLARNLGLEDLRERVARAHEAADQLQRALDSRVVIEQAKAFVAADRKIGVDEAFEVLRRHARSHNVKLREVATAVVEGFRP